MEGTLSRPHLLLLDSDVTGRETLAAALVQAGVDVTGMAPTEALPPDVAPSAALVIDDGAVPFNLAETLQAPGRLIYIALKTPSTEREQAWLVAGAAHVFVAEPLLAEALAGVLNDPTEMEGPFTPEGLAAAIDHVGARSAIITSTSDSGEAGTIWLRDGRIVDVQLGALAPGRALARLFTWKSGFCHLSIAPHDHDEAIALDAHLGGEEALRRAEVWHRLVAALGGIDAVFRVDYVALARQLADIPDDANVMLRLVDGQRPLTEIIDQVPFDELHTLAVATKLRVDGVLVPAMAFPEPPSAPAPAEGPPPEATESGPPLITVQAIDEALAWVAAPSMVPWTPTKGHIPVVQYSSTRGRRRERLLQQALELRGIAGQRDERPVMLMDEVLAPGALPIVATATNDRTEILVSAARSPVRQPTPPWRGLSVALAVVAAVLSAVIGVQSLGRPGGAVESMEPARVAPPAPAPVVRVDPPPLPVALPPPIPAPAPAPVPEVAVAPVPPAPQPKKTPPPATPEALLKAGAHANAQGEPTKAVPLLEEAVAKKKTAPALLELGKAYYGADKLPRAIETLKQATQLDAKLAPAFMYLGMACQDAKRPDDAKVAYKRFLELEPADSPRHAEIASVLNHL